MTRQLIVNADDFGRTRGVSAGILRAHLEGIVTSTTAMMNMPGVAADLHQAKSEAPRLGLGVHLNFTAGRPLLPPEWCASLVDEHGHFLTQEAIMANPDRLKPDELREELKSQITTFKNAWADCPIIWMRITSSICIRRCSRCISISPIASSCPRGFLFRARQPNSITCRPSLRDVPPETAQADRAHRSTTARPRARSNPPIISWRRSTTRRSACRS